MRGDGRNQLQIPAPVPLKEIFRMIPLSAKPISLDSPFNVEIGSAFLERVENSKKKNQFFQPFRVKKANITSRSENIFSKLVIIDVKIPRILR